MLFNQSSRLRLVFRLSCSRYAAMTRFDVISDVYGSTDHHTVSNSVDQSAIKKFPEKFQDFGFSWMTQSQILSGMRDSMSCILYWRPGSSARKTRRTWSTISIICRKVLWYCWLSGPLVHAAVVLGPSPGGLAAFPLVHEFRVIQIHI
jgi:hypothetical protein